MSTYHVPVREWHGAPVAPTTRLGRWAVLLAVVSGIGFLVALPAILFGDSSVWVPWALLLLVGVCARVCVCHRRLDRRVPGDAHAW